MRKVIVYLAIFAALFFVFTAPVIQECGWNASWNCSKGEQWDAVINHWFGS